MQEMFYAADVENLGRMYTFSLSLTPVSCIFFGFCSLIGCRV